jgi:hypothetical protein
MVKAHLPSDALHAYCIATKDHRQRDARPLGPRPASSGAMLLRTSGCSRAGREIRAMNDPAVRRSSITVAFLI